MDLCHKASFRRLFYWSLRINIKASFHEVFSLTHSNHTQHSSFWSLVPLTCNHAALLPTQWRVNPPLETVPVHRKLHNFFRNDDSNSKTWFWCSMNLHPINSFRTEPLANAFEKLSCCVMRLARGRLIGILWKLFEDIFELMLFQQGPPQCMAICGFTWYMPQNLREYPGAIVPAFG